MQPTWTVLVVALVGVAGTLGAAIFSQIWSARREDRRWRQEQRAEQLRWQREQQERREQWLREDRLRAGQHREEAYAQFLVDVAKWASAGYTVLGNLDQPDGWPDAEELARLAALAERAEASCAPLLLHGSLDVRTAADEVCQVMVSFVGALAQGPVARQRLDQAYLDFRKASDMVLDRMRQDLGPSTEAPAEASRLELTDLD